MAVTSILPGVVLLRDVDFGELSAESDKDLERYFVVTRDVDHIVRGTASLILGRKGSGKSSLFTQLENAFGMRIEDVLVVRVTPDGYAWQTLKSFEQQGVPLESAHTNAWLVTLLMQVAFEACALDTSGWDAEARRDVSVLQGFVQANFGGATPSLAQATRKLTQITSLDFSAFGAGFAAKVDRSDGGLLTPAVVQELKERLYRVSLSRRWLIALDKIDEAWDGTEQTKSLIIGLIKASKQINDDFGWDRGGNGNGIRTLVLLRTDIYDVLDYDDRDKHRADELTLGWTFDELHSMIEKRLPESVELDDVFESSSKQAGGRVPLGSFAYVVRQTFRRPREVIQFLIACQKLAPDAERIDESLVRRVGTSYSSVKLKDLKQEYQKSNPWLPRVLEALRGGPNKYENYAALEARLKERDADAIAAAGGAKPAIDFLFENSVIGTTQRLGGGTKYRAEAPELGLVPEFSLWIHPSLNRALDLVEPRPDTDTTTS